MALFGKKKPTAAPGGAPTGVPTDRILQMRQQGQTNDQIIQSLQQEGYSSSQIFDAMSQADIKGAVGGEVPQAEMPGAPPGGPMPESQPIGMEQAPPPMPEMQAPQAQAPPPMQAPMPPIPEMAPPMPEMQAPSAQLPPMPVEVDRAAIEEVAESIIDEKWEELMKNVDKIVAWKEETEAKLVKMEQMMKDIKERFEALHQGVLSKVSQYDKGIKGVSTDVKAMEQVFKKILPTFTANVNELSRLTKKIKPKKK
ncbi:MAG: hypothetical protein V3V78_00810 [Candidatus Woesearchaeota archaeon]